MKLTLRGGTLKITYTPLPAPPESRRGLAQSAEAWARIARAYPQVDDRVRQQMLAEIERAYEAIRDTFFTGLWIGVSVTTLAFCILIVAALS